MLARLFIAALLFASELLMAAPLGSAFTYQGRLMDNGTPANGRYDVRFELFAEEAGGTSSAGPIVQAGVAVTAGTFATTLDFSRDVLTGASLLLEIAVRPANQSSPFVTLAPRQPLMAVPYAIHSTRAETLTAPISESLLPSNLARLDTRQTFTRATLFNAPVDVGTTNNPALLEVHGRVRARTFAGDGSGLRNVVATGLSTAQMERLWRIPIPFVTVTNAGNAADTTGKGAVAYPFRIGKFEITHHQYAAFLNAIAAADPHELYSTQMSLDEHGGIERTGSPGDYRYTVKAGHGHRPVVWVDFRDAIRFCNWLHHGQPAGAQDASTTEDGAYTITEEGLASNNLPRNPGARYWVPNDDEWYKAAYHQPASAGGHPGDYWQYPTRSNDVPLSELPPGIGFSANACCDTGRRSTDVGAYLNTRSYYGTFDQAGNVEEWTEDIYFVTNRGLRGGSWDFNEFYSKSSNFEFDTIDYPSNAIGFRVAGAVLEP